jgi:hypothetical protein
MILHNPIIKTENEKLYKRGLFDTGFNSAKRL